MNASGETDLRLKYRRPSAPKIEGEARRKALVQYVEHYSKLAHTEPALLNQKLPRKAFESILDRIGRLLLEEADRMSTEDAVTRKFLALNKPPPCLGTGLTPQVRTFALLLNALSQWTTAQKLAMDRFLFSGNVRKELRSLAKSCPVCPEAFDPKAVELHHPVRDGRPPIPLSKKAHEEIEGVVRPDDSDEAGQRLGRYRNETKSSWVRLRVGCLIELGEIDEADCAYRRPYITDSKRRFRKAMEVTGLSAFSILEVLDRYDLGEISG